MRPSFCLCQVLEEFTNLENAVTLMQNMSRNYTYMTEEGFATISKEYNDLKSASPDFVKKLSQAADMGDRSENAAYSNAKRKLRSTDSRLRFLKKVIDHTKVVKTTQNEFIEIGSHVRLKSQNKEFTFHIVGLHEADPSKKKVSYSSPLGNALLGKRVGAVVKVMVPSGQIEYEVVEIRQ